mmetsp:Transcript_41157/g.46771  ORF Transcript_41157/g.46771 Transcript_41157/m.46771 type:complete len:83 (-) Transcript_41157:365-613(-)
MELFQVSILFVSSLRLLIMREVGPTKAFCLSQFFRLLEMSILEGKQDFSKIMTFNLTKLYLYLDSFVCRLKLSFILICAPQN